MGLYMAISGAGGTFGSLITSFAPVGDGISGLPSHMIKLKVGCYDYFNCNFSSSRRLATFSCND